MIHVRCVPTIFALVAALGAGLASVACGSSGSKADGCVPTSSITASGTLSIARASADKTTTVTTTYTLTAAQAEELFSSGRLTVMAGNTDAGAGALGPNDPVALVKMDPPTDEPGTYGLDAVHAQIAYCPPTDAKVVVNGGALSGCVPSGTPITATLQGSLAVTSASDKRIAPLVAPSGGLPVLLTAERGTQAQPCN
jgi:hypothetical protein